MPEALTPNIPSKPQNPGIQNMAPDQALWRLLKHRGSEISLQALREACGGDFTHDGILIELEQQGILARWAEIDPKDLSHLELPTLVESGEGWLLINKRDSKGFWIEDEKGELHCVDLQTLSSAFGSKVLDVTPALPDGSLWHRLWKMLLLHRKVLLSILISAALTQGLALLTPQFTRLLVDKAFPEGAKSLFMILVMGTLLVAAFQAWIGWLQQRFFLFLETRLEVLLERGLLSHLLRLPYAFLQSKTVGDLMQGFTGLNTAKDLITGEVLGSLMGGLTAIFYLVAMARLMPGPTLVVVAVTVVMAALTTAVGYRQAQMQRAQVENQAIQRSYLVEMFSGVPSIKAAGAESRVLDRWLGLLRKERFIGLRNQRLGILSNGGFNLVGQILNQGLMIWGGKLVLDGQLQLGELLAFTQMSSAFQSAVMGFSSAFIQLWMIKPYLEKVQDILHTEPLPIAPRSVTRPMESPLVIQDLWFRYSSDGPWVFQGLNMTVQPGEKHQIKGPSGFGKSTLLKLIAGLYQPEQGSISIGGLDTLKARAMRIYLPQFVQLFNGSILENLRLLSGGANRERITEAAQLTGLNEMVDDLPMGWETVVAAGGINFSGGQRQLIALTAVLASERSLLLLDEAMANLDHIRKARLLQSRIFEEKTILFASHDGGLEA
jgi:ATP-binding cassette, subfamily B, bacterial